MTIWQPHLVSTLYDLYYFVLINSVASQLFPLVSEAEEEPETKVSKKLKTMTERLHSFICLNRGWNNYFAVGLYGLHHTDILFILA